MNKIRKIATIVYHAYRRRLFPIENTKISQDIIKIAKESNIDVFIETGTYFGDTTYSLRDSFKKIYSIELSKELAFFAKKRFSKYYNIEILQGNSLAVMKTILDENDSRAIFWLDGHYSEGVTSRGDKDSPIVQEINHIISHICKNHIILIDDAHLFNGTDGYPTIEELKNILIKSSYKNMDIHDNIIFIK